MKGLKKLFMLTMCLLFIVGNSFPVSAATDIQDGLKVEITTNKESYEVNEDILVTITLENTNDFIVNNLSMQGILPEGMTIKDGQPNIDMLNVEAGQKLELSFVAVVKENAGTTDNTTDNNNENGGNNTDNSNKNVNNGNTSDGNQKNTSTQATANTSNTAGNRGAAKTGDNSSIFVMIVLLVLLIISAVAVLFAIRYKKKMTGILSVLICIITATTIFNVLGINALAEETESKQFTVSHNVTVGGETYAIVSKVMYDVYLNNKFSPSKDADLYYNDDLYATGAEENHIQYSDTGRKYIDNQIVVSLTEGQDNSTIENILKKYNAIIIGYNAVIREYQLKFNKSYTFEELEEIEEKIGQEVGVSEVRIPIFFPKPDTCESSINITNDKEWIGDWDNIPAGKNWGVEAIRADKAWSYLDKMSPVNIGIYDDEFEDNHDDLKFMFMEIPLCNTNTKESHGTHVSGTIGAQYNNKIGIAGVCPTPQLYGVSLNGIYDSKYQFTDISYSYALTYLIAMKECKVVNISLAQDAYEFASSKGSKTASDILDKEAIIISNLLSNLIKEGHEFVICVAAGNQGEVGTQNSKYRYSEISLEDYNKLDKGNKNMIGTYIGYIKDKNGTLSGIEPKISNGFFTRIKDKDIRDRIILVGAVALDENSNNISISKYSEIGDILAPGDKIHSTIRNNTYDNHMSGTSMASPHVAGVAGMIFAVNEELTGAEVKEIIMSTASGKYYYNLQDSQKLVNAYEAVKKTVEDKNKVEFAGGDGTKENPYQISNAKQLNAVRNNLSAHYIQVNDIDLSKYDNWEPIGDELDKFKGSYNGQGYKISNLTISESYDGDHNDEYIGLFGVSGQNASLRNINLYNTSIELDIQNMGIYVGGIVGYASCATINSCTVSGSINVVGVDKDKSIIDVSGIAGQARIYDSVNFCDINVTGARTVTVGGISTGNGFLIYNCPMSRNTNYGNILAEGIQQVACGGIVAGAIETIDHCINYGSISGKITSFNGLGYCKVGGIIAHNEGVTKNCINYGKIEGDSLVNNTNVIVGGIVGENYRFAESPTRVENCVNYGDIDSSLMESVVSKAGGIVGQSVNGKIVNCYNICSNINSNPDYIGRIVGYLYNTSITNSYSLDSTKINGEIPTQDVGSDRINGASMTEAEINEAIQNILKELGLDNTKMSYKEPTVPLKSSFGAEPQIIENNDTNGVTGSDNVEKPLETENQSKEETGSNEDIQKDDIGIIEQSEEIVNDTEETYQP